MLAAADVAALGAAAALVWAASAPKLSTGDAVLMISELEANGVRHAHSRLRVLAFIAEQTLRVEVSDDDPTLPVVAADAEHQALGGRGLRIVDELADRWGITPNPGGKAVWFELHLRRAGLP